MLKSTRLGIYFSLNETFTCAILPAHTAVRERDLSAILEIRGNLILFSGDLADPPRSLPDRIGTAVAGLCAAAHAHGSGLLFAEGCSAVSVQRDRSRSRAKPGFTYRIRLSKLRDFLSDRFGHRSGIQRSEARCFIFPRESARGDYREA